MSSAYDMTLKPTWRLPACYIQPDTTIWHLIDESPCCLMCDAYLMWFDPKVDNVGVCWDCVDEHNDQVTHLGRGIVWVPDTGFTADLCPIQVEWTGHDIDTWMRVLNTDTPRDVPVVAAAAAAAAT